MNMKTTTLITIMIFLTAVAGCRSKPSTPNDAEALTEHQAVEKAPSPTTPPVVVTEIDPPVESDAAAVVDVIGDVASFDLGPIEPGSKHTIIFQIQNDSQESLDILKVRIECRCMKVIDKPDTIGPGKTGTVKVELTTPGKAKSSNYSKLVLLKTSSPDRSIIRLRLKATIILPMQNQTASDGPSKT